MDPPETFPVITGMDQMSFITELTAFHTDRIELVNMPELAFKDIENIIDGRAVREQLKSHLTDSLSMQNTTSWKSSCTLKIVIVTPEFGIVNVTTLQKIVNQCVNTILAVSKVILPSQSILAIKNFNITQSKTELPENKSYSLFISVLPF
jgi:hypothetical protein